MRILLDLQSCQSGSRLGGIGRYSLDLAKAMMKYGGSNGHEFQVFLNGTLPGVNEIKLELVGYVELANIIVFSSPRGISWQGKNPELAMATELMRDWFIANLAPDIVHVTSAIEGNNEDVVISASTTFGKFKTVATVYDLIPAKFPELYLQDEFLKQKYFERVSSLEEADALLSISEYTKNEALELLHLDKDAVVNISGGVGGRLSIGTIDEKTIGDVLHKFGLHKEFVIYVASFDKRKNHRNLIEAFALLEPSIRSTYQLAIVGNGWPGIYSELLSLASACGLAEGDVVFTGFVTDDELNALYTSAKLMVFPSIAEGFGLPVLEAMQFGLPVIASNATSLPEVLGNESALFDPESPTSIASKMLETLTDDSLLMSMRNKGLARARDFTWDKSASIAINFLQNRFPETNNEDGSAAVEVIDTDTLVSTIKKTVNNGLGLTTRSALALAQSISANEAALISHASRVGELTVPARIDWVSTFNTRCGIAAYSKHLVRAMPETEIRVYATRRDTNDDFLASNVIKCWDEGNDDLEALSSNLLNSNSQAVIVQLNYGFFNFHRISKLLLELKAQGKIVLVELHSTVDPDPSILNRKMSDLAYALAAIDGVLVHSQDDINRLMSLGLASNVAIFPLGFMDESIAPKEIDPGLFRLSTYGFCLPNKGLVEVVGAVGLLVQQGIPVHLTMLNSLYPVQESATEHLRIMNEIKKLALEGFVSVSTEFMDDQATLERLSQTDVSIFAYGNTGESSSAAAKMALSAGNLIALSPSRIFEDLREVSWQMGGCDPQAIAEALTEIWTQLRHESQHIDVIKQRAWDRVRKSSHTSNAAWLKSFIDEKIAQNDVSIVGA